MDNLDLVVSLSVLGKNLLTDLNDTALVNKTVTFIITAQFSDGTINKDSLVII
jgi:hypothetical protein